MAEVEKLKNTLKELESEIAVKKTEVEGLEASKRILAASIEPEMAKAKEEVDRIIEDAKMLADEIVSEAERRREKELYEAEQLRKEREKPYNRLVGRLLSLGAVLDWIESRSGCARCPLSGVGRGPFVVRPDSEAGVKAVVVTESPWEPDWDVDVATSIVNIPTLPYLYLSLIHI